MKKFAYISLIMITAFVGITVFLRSAHGGFYERLSLHCAAEFREHDSDFPDEDFSVIESCEIVSDDIFITLEPSSSSSYRMGCSHSYALIRQSEMPDCVIYEYEVSH